MSLSPLAIDLFLAALPFTVGMIATWRLIWPRWKVFGKGIAYLCGVTLGSIWIGHWILVLAYLHQGIGLVFHLWFCRRHGFTWYAVEDPDRYKELSMALVGFDPPSPPVARAIDGVPMPQLQTMQHEGAPPPAIEWYVDDEIG